ncbi:hypothetical protein XACS581_2390001 [Xanthomonas citri pv. citri]|nr:hypothetical protein XACS581_2390001 [Xanthomonas citri pv. citri]
MHGFAGGIRMGVSLVCPIGLVYPASPVMKKPPWQGRFFRFRPPLITPAGCLIVLVRLVLNLPSCRASVLAGKVVDGTRSSKPDRQKREPAGLAASAHRPP